MSRTNRFEMDMGRKPYERQPNEPDRAWAAFVVYRDLGLEERSLVKAAGVIRKRTGGEGSLDSKQNQLERWSFKYQWRFRCEEWDRVIDDRRRRVLLTDVDRMRERHINVARNLQVFGQRELTKLLRESQVEEKVVVGVNAILSAINDGVELERKSMGQPTSIVESQVTMEDRREALQKLVSDPDARAALELLNEKLDESQSGN